MGKATKADRAAALETLRRCVQEGDTLVCVLRSVSASGMGRRLDVYNFTPATRDTGHGSAKRQVERSYLTSCAATVCGYRHTLEDWKRGKGLYVGGCGFDAGHEVVQSISRALFGRVDALRMEWL